MNASLVLKLLPNYEGLPLPEYVHDGDSGFDLRSAEIDSVTLMPGQRLLIKTGLAAALEEGTELQIRSRSGLALNYGVIVLNAPGTIDAGYRGEIGVILYNSGTVPFGIHRGDRIAQAVFAEVIQPVIDFEDELDETTRGDGGFGSTGVH